MNNNTNKIAVIGMACRFPDAESVDEYWNNLLQGKDCMTRLNDEDIAKVEPYFDSVKDDPDYIRVKGIIRNIDKFDEAFFGMTPREAADTDPQQRIWLETAWQALEDAGCDPSTYSGAIGVYAGGSSSSYLINNILRDPARMEDYLRPGNAESGQVSTVNDISYLPTKTAYHFDLKGPAVFVQTACSTSMVAIIEACKSLYSYESDICLAGGVRILVPQEKGYLFQEGSISSPDGHCRPFDASANGTASGNGLGVVVLKRLEDAINDHDNIYAVVSGWALNNDGKNKVSFAAPSIDGQAEVIMMAQSFAEVSPEEIGYVEAHGTATHIGDPIEVAALTKAFSANTKKKQYCGLGSVKSNIGHTDAAAGVASFIKACLSAYYKKIPGTINYKSPNPLLDLENTPFYVLDHVKEWNDKKPLIIGVSSFGIGGTNSHVIVEEPPMLPNGTKSTSEWPKLLVLSAKSETSLNNRKQDLIDFLKRNNSRNLANVASTLAYGRSHMQYRSFIVASDLNDITEGENKFVDGKTIGQQPGIALMFPGQGAQYAGMGLDLYNKNQTFRTILDECFSVYKEVTNEDIKPVIFDTGSEQAEARLAKTEVTQPALFIIEYALAKVLENLDIKADYFIGHSIGEFTAACLAGVFDMPTALKIVIKRGQLMSSMQPGNMMAVRTSKEKLKSLNSQCFEIAADNSDDACTISFKTEDSEKVKAVLGANDIQSIPLNTSHAFHSAAFDPILSDFEEFVNRFSLNSPRIPFISCLTGDFITDSQAKSGEYWAKQLRNTVLFREGISKIAKNEGVVFLEVGPNTHLSSIVKKAGAINDKKLIISTLGKADNTDERNKIITALGNLFNKGYSLNFSSILNTEEHIKIPLPVYPFEKRRHWIDFEMNKCFTGTNNNQSFSPGPADDKWSTQGETKSQAEETIAADKVPSEGNIPNPVEEMLLKIWSDTFMKKDIKVTDNFFEIGGDSLLAVTVISKIKFTFKITLPIKVFLKSPVIKDLAVAIQELMNNK
jgi:acyl transferase domain-containing protein/acyl carrier protein